VLFRFLLDPAHLNKDSKALNVSDTPHTIVRSQALHVPTLIPRVHVFGLQDALNIFGASGRAVCVSEATTVSPSTAIFMALGSAEDPSETLSDLLAKSSVVPTSTSVAIINDEPNAADLLALRHLQVLETFIHVSAATSLLRQYPQGWDFGDSASVSEYNHKYATALFDVLEKGLNSFLVQDSVTDQSFNKSVDFSDLHLEFLKGIFDSFGLSKSQLAELDDLLTSVTKSLLSVKTGFEQSSGGLDHALFVTYFEKMQGIEYNIPKIRLFFLHIDQASWLRLVEHKHRHNDVNPMINFNMSYTDSTYTMTWMPSEDEFARVQKMLEKMTGMQIGALVDRYKVDVIKA